MKRYLIRRLLEVIPTTFGIILLTFLLFHVVGGSPAQVVLGKNATKEAIAAFDAKYGYDKPLFIGAPDWKDSQFCHYVGALAKGDMGISTEHQRPVADVLKEGVGASLMLTVPILIGGSILGVGLALLCAAWRGGKWDRASLVFSTILMSVNYVIWVLSGQFLLAYRLHLFPIWGFESAFYLVLPVCIGIFSGLGRDVRFFRAVILDEVYKPYVRTAQAKGLPGWRIMLVHVFRNSLLPILTYISLSIPFLFTGSLLLESFFGIPGLGNISINAINSSDMAVVRAVVVLGALLYQAVQLVTDLCYARLDPRIRLN